MRNLYSSFFAIVFLFLLGCKENDIRQEVNSGSLIENDRFKVNSLQGFKNLLDSVNNLNLEQTINFSSQLKSKAFYKASNDSILIENGKKILLPRAFSALLNNEMEFQLDKNIAWFYRGDLYIIPENKLTEIKDILSKSNNPLVEAKSKSLTTYHMTNGIDLLDRKSSLRTNGGITFRPGDRYLAFSTNSVYNNQTFKKEIYINCSDWYYPFGEYGYQIYYSMEFQKYNSTIGQWEYIDDYSGFFRFFNIELDGNILYGTSLNSPTSRWEAPQHPNNDLYSKGHGIIRYHFLNVPSMPTNVYGKLVMDSYFEMYHNSGTVTGNIDLW